MLRGGGNPSAIFCSSTMSSDSSKRGHSTRSPTKKKHNNPGNINTSVTVPITKRESIVHRLNHLTLLINSSGIDLNIALNESDFNNETEQSISSPGKFSTIAEDSSESSACVSSNSKTLTSIASQSKKRRSVLEMNKVIPNTSVNKQSINGSNSVTAIRKAPVKEVRFALCGNSANNVSYVGKDGLLDAFLVLYDECCSNDEYKKDTLLQEFVKKCKWPCQYILLIIVDPLIG